MRRRKYVPLNYADFLPERKSLRETISEGIPQSLKYFLAVFIGVSTFGLGWKYVKWLFR